MAQRHRVAQFGGWVLGTLLATGCVVAGGGGYESTEDGGDEPPDSASLDGQPQEEPPVQPAEGDPCDGTEAVQSGTTWLTCRSLNCNGDTPGGRLALLCESGECPDGAQWGAHCVRQGADSTVEWCLPLGCGIDL